MILQIDVSDKIVIIGYSGCGKTTLLKYFIKNLSYPQLIIDTTNQFTHKVHIRYKGLLKPLKEFDKPNKWFVKIQTQEDLEKIIKKINDKYNTELMLVIDEIDQYTDVHQLLPEVSLFFQQGRNYSHGGIFTVRQIGRLNKEILSNSHYLFLFKIFNKSDIQYISNIIGYNILPLIVKLNKHDFYIIDLHNTQILNRFILEANEIRKV